MKPTAAPWRRVRLGLPVVACALALMLAAPAPASSASSVADREAQVRAATADVDASSKAAGVALEEYQSAVRDQAALQLGEVLIAQQLADSRAQVRSSRATVGRWARVTYQQGGALSEVSQWLTLLQGTPPAEVSRNLVALREISRGAGSVQQNAESEQRLVALSAARAQAASAASVAAARRAEQARERSEELVQAQRTRLATLSALLEGSRQAEQEARRREAWQRAQRLVAAGAAQARAAGVLPPGVGCQGSDLTAYANGMIDPSALCPLWAAPNQLLRADAAAAFDALARAWAADFGAPPCVGDSYRPFADQVRLYALKPSLAARPGTSNHGWGVALDLCGGVERFDSPQHQWMVRNAPQFGWFHPQWAQAGGGRPEPWHWEFAG